MDDQELMQRALKLAQEAFSACEVPIGAVLAIDGEIIAEGRNRTEELQDATAHAEMQAIRAAMARIGNWRLQKAVLYTTLEPCSMCAGACLLSRVDRIVFGASDLRHGAAGTVVDVFAPFSIHRPQVEGGLYAEESAELLKQFFRERRASS